MLESKRHIPYIGAKVIIVRPDQTVLRLKLTPYEWERLDEYINQNLPGAKPKKIYRGSPDGFR